MPEVLISPPDSEPVTLAEARAHLIVETAEDDELIKALIVAARVHAEGWCNRGFVTQGWKAILAGFPHQHPFPFPLLRDDKRAVERLQHDYVELPHGNLASVESVKYVDATGAEVTLSPSVYSIDAATVPGRLRPVFDETWPDARLQWDAVRVEYTVGWEVADVPTSVKQAVLLLVAQMYEHRVPEVERALSSIQFGYEALLSQHKIYHL